MEKISFCCLYEKRRGLRVEKKEVVGSYSRTSRCKVFKAKVATVLASCEGFTIEDFES